jgi:large subunit ribosomal protein L24
MSRPKMRIKKDDTVIVIAGKEKGKSGRVLRVDPTRRRIIVEGVCVVKRHQKPVGEQPGGIIHKEASIHISNVALWDAEQGRRVKVGYQTTDNQKQRVDRKTGAVLDKA